MLSRRDLLVPRPLPIPAQQPPISLFRYRQTAMATAWEIVVPAAGAGQLDLIDSAFELLHQIEARLTVYLEDSEVSSLNRLAKGQATRVSPMLASLLERCVAWHAQTRGAFDIACGRMIKSWGFFRGPAGIPEASALASQVEVNGMDKLEYLAESKMFTWKSPGVELNLGCVGKGFTVDEMAAVLSTGGGIPAGMIQCGGSSARAWGPCPGEVEGWRVAVRHPWVEGKVIAEVVVKDASIGTSAGSFRHLLHEGRRLPHVLDPRTGWPAEGLATVTVLAPDAGMADALSTAFFVLGVEESAEILGQWPEISALFMKESGKISVIGQHSHRFHVCCS
ncbi:MAG: FAD:protein FMN transferase [Planctomycetota bacterium]